MQINLTSPIIIKPKKGLWDFNLKELWEYRELAYFFVWREIKIRYKQTAVGILWAVFQPLCTMVIFTIFFGNLGKIPSDNVPYPVFVYVGLLLWNYFSFSLSHASRSMVSNAGIVQKIYFPRLIFPISSSLIGLVDFIISFFILLGLTSFYHCIPSLRGLLYLPFLVLLTFLTSVGLGSFLASVNVKYRDVQYIVPFFVQMLMFLTPVIYPVSIVGSQYRWLLRLNPMSAVIETARSAILNSNPIDIKSLLFAFVISLLLFIAGVLYFKKTEAYFADVI